MPKHDGKNSGGKERNLHVLSLLRAAIRDLASVSSYSSVVIATVDCMVSMLHACPRVAVNSSNAEHEVVEEKEKRVQPR